MKVDLHIHTSYSDGVFSPEKIVDTALDVGLDAIAITDHDHYFSATEAIEYGLADGIVNYEKIMKGE